MNRKNGSDHGQRTVSDYAYDAVMFVCFLVVFWILIGISVAFLFGAVGSRIDLIDPDSVLSQIFRVLLAVVPISVSGWASWTAVQKVNRRNSAPGPSGSQKPMSANVARTLAVLLVVSGLFLGFLVGGSVGFGACFKSECSVLEATAPITVSVATLVFTVPTGRRIVQKQSDAFDSDTSTTDRIER